MLHGIDAYYAEIARLRRRVSQIGLGVSAVCLAIIVAITSPRGVQTLSEAKRWGYEGRDEYVHRILIENVSDQEQPGNNLQNLIPVNLHAGGGKRSSSLSNDGRTPTAKRNGTGQGEDEIDLQARARALALAGPVIHSEDLIVEKLVRPDYPEDAQDANIEGVVELFALVDTTGDVLEVHLAGGSGDPSLERAATSAVLQCRYRPYRMNRDLQRVWAFFRINFRLY